MRIIELENKFCTGVFPRHNKLDTIPEYYAEWKKEGGGSQHPPQPELVQVERVVLLDAAEFSNFRDNLLTDRDWLAGRGGHRSQHDVGDRGYFDLTEDEREKWSKSAYRVCDIVVREYDNPFVGDNCLVDPQGYNYVRYLGFPGFEGYSFLKDIFRQEAKAALEKARADRKKEG